MSMFWQRYLVPSLVTVYGSCTIADSNILVHSKRSKKELDGMTNKRRCKKTYVISTYVNKQDLFVKGAIERITTAKLRRLEVTCVFYLHQITSFPVNVLSFCSSSFPYQGARAVRTIHPSILPGIVTFTLNSYIGRYTYVPKSIHLFCQLHWISA